MSIQTINIMKANYLILDGARIGENIDKADTLNKQNISLYNRKGEEYLRTVAPYLFTFDLSSDFASWIDKESWGKSWGIFIASNSNIEQLQNHLRNFITANTEDGNQFYFRFYDPRVLRVFLPSCDLRQLTEFFGPVECYSMEDEDPKFVLRFRFENNKLIRDRISKYDFLASN